MLILRKGTKKTKYSVTGQQRESNFIVESGSEVGATVRERRFNITWLS